MLIFGLPKVCNKDKSKNMYMLVRPLCRFHSQPAALAELTSSASESPTSLSSIPDLILATASC